MKKSSFVMAVLALSTVFGGLVSAQAAVCGPNNTDPNGRTKADPFGSCETSSGTVRCGSTGATDVGGVFTLIVKQSGGTGVQGCSGPNDALPIGGRVSVLVDANNNVAIGVDGSDNENSGGASAWQRYDVRPNDQAVCARRGSAGTWWDGNNGGRGTSNPDSVNQGINPSLNRAPCGGSPVPA
jgi:hypothetical protein